MASKVQQPEGGVPQGHVEPFRSQAIEPTPRRSSHRLLGLVVIGATMCGIAWMYSRYWDHQQAGAQPVTAVLSPAIDTGPALNREPDPELERLYRYGGKLKVTTESLTPEVMALLEKLSASFGTLSADVDATEARLRQADPHLDRALDDPVGVPFRSDNPTKTADVLKGFLPKLEGMLEDFAIGATEREQELVAPLRHCMTATLFKQPMLPDEIAKLRQARENGLNSPLVLVCLFRCSNDDEEKFTLIRQAQAAKQSRQVCPETAALISSNLVLYNNKLSRAEFASATESFIADTVKVWTVLSAPDVTFAAQDFFVSYLYNGMNRMNANGKVDLLLAMSHQDDPPITPWIMHLVANVILKSGASNYRGGDFISTVSPENLRKFSELAELQTSHLLRAWTLAPGHDLLPALLMGVEMRAGSTPRSVDHWFRHSLSARFEYNFNFPTYEESVRARWGGSSDKQLWLAHKYVETGDLDSKIPVRLMRPLWSINQDSGRSLPLGTDLKIRRIAYDFVRLLQSYSRDTPHPSVQPGVATIVAIILWEAGEYEALDWLFTVYADLIVCKQYHENRLHAGEMKLITKAILADRSLRWMTIRRTLFSDTRKVTFSDLDQTDLAIDEARDLDDGSDSDYSELLSKCEGLASNLRKLLNYETIVLSDDDLQSWLIVDDSISVSFPRRVIDGESQGATYPLKLTDESVGVVDVRIWIPGQAGLMMCPLQVDPPVSLSMDVEELETGDDPYGISLLIGPALAVADLTGFNGSILTLNSAHQNVICDRLPVADWKENMKSYHYSEPRAKHTIKIEAFPDGYRTYYGDKRMETARVPLKTGGLLQLGRYVSFNYTDMPQEHVKYRVSNVQLQKLKATSIDEK